MSADLKIVSLPVHNVGDIATGLRNLADQIEKGERGHAHNLVWVIDRGDGHLDVGMLGPAAEPGAVGHMLLALAQRKLELSIAKEG